MQKLVDNIFIGLKKLEEKSFSSAVVLQGFPRSIQLDGYSCGAKSVYTVLKYFGKNCTPRSVERQLGTTYEGTSQTDIKRVLKERNLSYHMIRRRTLKTLRDAIDNECPIFISLYDGWHYSVVYGYSDSHIFVMNPSLDFTSMGSIWNAVSKPVFRKIWDRWGIIVTDNKF